jgi:succinate-acetate transporter protein
LAASVNGFSVSTQEPQTLRQSLTEHTLGNTFPATVFCLYGGFWLTFGATIVPDYGAYGAYSTTGEVAQGLEEPMFYATFAFLLLAMGILTAIFTVASIRTNIVLFGILLLLTPTCKLELPSRRSIALD